MRTNLDRKINSLQDAHDYMRDLHKNGELYHFDDDAHKIDWEHTVCSPEEADKVNYLRDRVWEFDQDPHQLGLWLSNRVYANHLSLWANDYVKSLGKLPVEGGSNGAGILPSLDVVERREAMLKDCLAELPFSADVKDRLFDYGVCTTQEGTLTLYPDYTFYDELEGWDMLRLKSQDAA